jgi:hypothetical protein
LPFLQLLQVSLLHPFRPSEKQPACVRRTVSDFRMTRFQLREF